MTSEAAAIERFLALYEGEGDPADPAGMWAPGARAKVNTVVVSPEEVVAEAQAIAAAVPNGRFERVGRLDKDGETSIVWTLSGIHERSFMDREATGEEVKVEGATRFRLDAATGCITRLVCRWSGL